MSLAIEIATLTGKVNDFMDLVKGQYNKWDGEVKAKIAELENLKNSLLSSSFGIKNKIINGDFRIWQRGASIEANGRVNFYSVDRMFVNGYGFNGRIEHITDDAQFPEAVCSFTIDDILEADGTKWVGIGQIIENFHSILSNKEITLSVWLKASANTSVNLLLGHNNPNPINITTAWQKFSFTVTYADINSEEHSKNFFGITQVNDSYSGTIFLAEMQLEQGLVATPFEQRPIGLELSLCQRFFTRSSAVLTTSTQHTLNRFPNTMRVIPTIKTTYIAGSDTLAVSNFGIDGFRTVADNNVDYSYTADAEI